MNVFKLIDESIRGLILIIFSFIGTTTLLVFHPLHGAMKLYLESKREGGAHISSLTYLALCMLMSVLLVARFVSEAGAEENLPNAIYRGIKVLMSGDSSLAPLGGALAGTLILAAIPRLLAWGRGLKGRRRERFVVGSEYAFGATVLLMSCAFALFSWAIPWAEEALLVAVSYLATGLVYIPGVILAVHFWAALLRNPVPIRKLDWLWARRKSWRRGGGLEGRRAELLAFHTEFLELQPNEKISVVRRRLLGWVFILVAAFLAPLLLALTALVGGAFAFTWIQAQEASRTEQPLEFLAGSCHLGAAQPFASAAVINKTDAPVAGWLTKLSIEVHFPSQPDPVSRLRWAPKLAGDRLTDLIAPGQIVEITGPIQVTRQLQERVRSAAVAYCAVGQGADDLAE